MEKIGLFDLIDKFNAAARGKNELEKKQSTTASPEGAPASSKFTDPKIIPPKHYLMNAKMQDFCIKHDEFAKKIGR
ncbi:MAG: hypothetical protein IKA61_05905 [Clostridia bacterium]|nr:hypothetical protein [Clostridia bacterium]